MELFQHFQDDFEQTSKENPQEQDGEILHGLGRD